MVKVIPYCFAIVGSLYLVSGVSAVPTSKGVSAVDINQAVGISEVHELEKRQGLQGLLNAATGSNNKNGGGDNGILDLVGQLGPTVGSLIGSNGGGMFGKLVAKAVGVSEEYGQKVGSEIGKDLGNKAGGNLGKTAETTLKGNAKDAQSLLTPTSSIEDARKLGVEVAKKVAKEQGNVSDAQATEVGTRLGDGIGQIIQMAFDFGKDAVKMVEEKTAPAGSAGAKSEKAVGAAQLAGAKKAKAKGVKPKTKSKAKAAKPKTATTSAKAAEAKPKAEAKASE
ncbi:uncharacterized protein VTP21DRAFT_8832 [Calcarisporiella thermophila]|uniref:uncharacterized protein n=1 Tax=Calcarisporiella thermophila TaxID=911321 RepID=UPI0037424C86